MGYTFRMLTIAFVLVVRVTYAQLSCNFEGGYCGWSTPSSSDQLWHRSRDKSRTLYTGPETGHTTFPSKNFYIYQHALDFRIDGAFTGGTCILLSPLFNTSLTGGCLRFWYHMNGSGIGNISVVTIGSANQPWAQSGSQGDVWRKVDYSVNELSTNIQLRIITWTGLNPQGDIALDDFEYFSERCSAILNGDIRTTSSVDPTNTETITTTVTTDMFTGLRTTPERIDEFSDIMLYVTLIPLIVIVVGSITAFIVYKRCRKSPHKTIPIVGSCDEPCDDIGGYCTLNDMAVINNGGLNNPTINRPTECNGILHDVDDYNRIRPSSGEDNDGYVIPVSSTIAGEDRRRVEWHDALPVSYTKDRDSDDAIQSSTQSDYITPVYKT